MGFLTLVIVLIPVIWASYHVLRSNPWRRRMFPPGPYPFPIIGNLLQLSLNPHQSLAELSKTYGPLMSIQLGSTYTAVISSPEVAKQVLQEHDQVFSGRTIVAAAEVHDHHNNSMGFMPAGKKWRKTRKICREHMFSTQRLDAGQGLRWEKLQKLCEYVSECCLRGKVVNVGEAVFITSLNLITATLFSVDFTDFESKFAQDLKGTVEGIMKILGAPNVADFFPVFKRIDPQGIRRESEIHFGKLFGMLGEIVDQRLESRRLRSSDGSSKKDDMLETLLDLMEESDYNLSIKELKHLLLDLFIGGTHTMPSTVEWAMAELLLNPEKMANAKNEVRSVIGENNQVQESDISKLPYIQAVIKETFRLHPAGPLLIPRRADHEVEINGYTIPKDAQILVNVWAIGRDPSIWGNSTSFEPERFINSKIDFKGQDFTLLPFGSGRRICPGVALADRMVNLTVATLIHNFDWQLEPGVKPEDVDMNEKFGMALHKAVPLMVIPIKV